VIDAGDIYKADIQSGSVLSGWPWNPNFGAIWGMALDNTLGRLWLMAYYSDSFYVYDEQTKGLVHSSDLGAITGDLLVQPINAIVHGDFAYIAGFATKKIYKISTSTHTVTSAWLRPGVLSSLVSGNIVFDYVDLFVHNDKLYLVANDMPDLIVSDLDGKNPMTIAVPSESPLRGAGVFVASSNEIWINKQGKRVLKIDSAGKVLNSWDVQQGFSYAVRDIHVHNGLVYLPFSNGQKVFIYQEN
jgi:hypothetical protein